MKIFITGISGFIGFHTALKLSQDHEVLGVDSFNDTYDVSLKRSRQKILEDRNIKIIERDIMDFDFYDYIKDVDAVIHLAGYSNVRMSLEDPLDYVINNIAVTQRLKESCEIFKIEKVLYASTSCVMEGQELPWKDTTKEHYHPSSPYGWSKYVNECQFKSSKIPKHYGMRFFTVYGTYGRPDMAVHSFTKDIIEGNKLTIYGHGKMKRDFTYIDDAVNGILVLLGNNEKSNIYNIANSQPVYIMDMVVAIETKLGIKGHYNLVDKHPAEVMQTLGDISTMRYMGYDPKVHYTRGIEKFVTWYKQYYGKLN